MIDSIVVAAHGFSTYGKSSPTHVDLQAFRDWLARCRSRNVEFGTVADVAISRSIVDIRPMPYSGQRFRTILTFDDALSSVEKAAESLPCPAALFVVSDHVGKFNDWPSQPLWVTRERCLSWSALRALAESGWSIGAHTMTHPRLSRLSESQQRKEIEHSKNTIEDRLGCPCNYFAYPYGDAPASARSIVAELGMIGFGTRPGLVTPHTVRSSLPRVDLYDLVRAGFVSSWAWKPPGIASIAMLRCKRTLGLMRSRICSA